MSRSSENRKSLATTNASIAAERIITTWKYEINKYMS